MAKSEENVDLPVSELQKRLYNLVQNVVDTAMDYGIALESGVDPKTVGQFQNESDEAVGCLKTAIDEIIRKAESPSDAQMTSFWVRGPVSLIPPDLNISGWDGHPV